MFLCFAGTPVFARTDSGDARLDDVQALLDNYRDGMKVLRSSVYHGLGGRLAALEAAVKENRQLIAARGVSAA